MKLMILNEDMANLKHMLGVRGRRSRWAHRNHFAPGADTLPSMKRLEAQGLVRSGGLYRDGRHYYHATPEAGRLLGFGRVLMARAFGGDK